MTEYRRIDSYSLIALVCFGLLLSCQDLSQKRARFEELEPPLAESSMQPYLFWEGEELYMTWTEVNGQGEPRLVMSSFSHGSWGERTEVAKGSDWFVNWADFPGFSKSGNSMITHFLKKSDTATFAYDVQYLHSSDSGLNWSGPSKLHSDSIKAEHGFVSFSPAGNDSFLSVWLDGRNTSGDGRENSGLTHEAHGGPGAMQLRSGLIDASGRVHGEQLIDDRTCDCCQTSLAVTSSGILVAYRDRSEQEIRDIYISLLQEGSWSTPKPVYSDNWKIAGCPVNGPKLASMGNSACLAWFTAARDQPQVKIAFSDDGGLNFDPPIRIDDGMPMGRVDAAMLDRNTALVSWMETIPGGAQIRLATVDRTSGEVSSLQVADVPGGRSTGFPQLEVGNKQIFLAWNVSGETGKRIRSVRLDLEQIYP